MDNKQMILLIGGTVYTPDYLGIRDILLASGKIVGIADEIAPPEPDELVKTLNVHDMVVVPGFIDSHVHIVGGGGENGPITRTPEVQFEDLVQCGITTVVGLLGTDGIFKTTETLLYKCQELRTKGMSCYILTGSFKGTGPTIIQSDPNLIGNVEKDITLFEEIIGLGEVAVADNRAHVSNGRLARLADAVNRGAMLAGKKGVIVLHLGNRKSGHFKTIDSVLEITGIAPSQFIADHCSRSKDILEGAIDFAKKGGYISFTAGAYMFLPGIEKRPFESIEFLKKHNVPLDKIIISSDGQGSIWSNNGKMGVLSSSSLLKGMKAIIQENVLSREDTLQLITSNPADALGLKNKGRIKVGKDADLVILNNNFDIVYVIARGKIVYSKA